MKKLILALALMVAPAALFAQKVTPQQNSQVNPTTNAPVTNTKPVVTRPTNRTIPEGVTPNMGTTNGKPSKNFNKNLPNTGKKPAITDKKKKQSSYDII